MWHSKSKTQKPITSDNTNKFMTQQSPILFENTIAYKLWKNKRQRQYWTSFMVKGLDCTVFLIGIYTIKKRKVNWNSK